MPGHSYKGSRGPAPVVASGPSIILTPGLLSQVSAVMSDASVVVLDGYESSDSGATWYLQDPGETTPCLFIGDNTGDLYVAVRTGTGPPPVSGQSNTVVLT